jgi:undecaprenyl pyrophosphate phosphatase UppP
MPAWFVLPVATLAMLLLAAHLVALGAVPMDARRRRIRVANNVLMMFLTALLAYGFCVVKTTDVRTFVLVWTVVPALLVMVILLALFDMLNSVQIHRRDRRELRRRLSELQAARPGDEPRA